MIEESIDDVFGYKKQIDENRSVWMSQKQKDGSYCIQFSNGTIQTRLRLSDDALQALFDIRECDESISVLSPELTWVCTFDGKQPDQSEGE